MHPMQYSNWQTWTSQGPKRMSCYTSMYCWSWSFWYSYRFHLIQNLARLVGASNPQWKVQVGSAYQNVGVFLANGALWMHCTMLQCLTCHVVMFCLMFKTMAEGETLKTKRVAKWYHGGVASAMATCFTHPLDLLKVGLFKEVYSRNIIS